MTLNNPMLELSISPTIEETMNSIPSKLLNAEESKEDKNTMHTISFPEAVNRRKNQQVKKEKRS